MYLCSLALITKGSLLLTCSMPRACRSCLLWPGKLKCSLDGSSDFSFPMYPKCLPRKCSFQYWRYSWAFRRGKPYKLFVKCVFYPLPVFSIVIQVWFETIANDKRQDIIKESKIFVRNNRQFTAASGNYFFSYFAMFQIVSIATLFLTCSKLILQVSYVLNWTWIVKPKSEVPKSKVPKSRPKGLGLTQ